MPTDQNKTTNSPASRGVSATIQSGITTTDSRTGKTSTVWDPPREAQTHAITREQFRNAGKTQTATPATPTTQGVESPIPSYRKGGKVKRTGLARVHKGERVLTRKQTRKYKSRGGGR